MKKMKVLKNGKILYKLDKEKLEERIKEMGFKSIYQFNISIGRNEHYIQDLFRYDRRNGYVKIEIIEFLANQLKLPHADYLIEDGEEEETISEQENVDLKADIEELKNLIIKGFSMNDDLVVRLKAKPNDKVYFLEYISSENDYIISEGFIVGYWISMKLNITYKIQKAETGFRYDVRDENVFTSFEDAQNKKEAID